MPTAWSLLVDHDLTLQLANNERLTIYYKGYAASKQITHM